MMADKWQVDADPITSEAIRNMMARCSQGIFPKVVSAAPVIPEHPSMRNVSECFAALREKDPPMPLSLFLTLWNVIVQACEGQTAGVYGRALLALWRELHGGKLHERGLCSLGGGDGEGWWER